MLLDKVRERNEVTERSTIKFPRPLSAKDIERLFTFIVENLKIAQSAILLLNKSASGRDLIRAKRYKILNLS